MKFSKKEIVIYSCLGLVFVALIVALFTIAFTYFPHEFINGDGSVNNPYQICTQEDLLGLAENVNHGNTYEGYYFTLQNDIHLTDDVVWKPIGYGNNVFKGCFNGNNKTVYNMHLNDGFEWNGFFGNVENIKDSCVIYNFNIDVCYAVLQENFDALGFVAARCTGNIDNIDVFGEMSVASNEFNKLGVIIGELNGNATNCHAAGLLHVDIKSLSERYVSGGFAILKGNLSNCYCEVKIEETLMSAGYISKLTTGGVVALYDKNDGKIDNCVNYFTIDSFGTTGGVIGRLSTKCTVSNCSSYGLIQVSGNNTSYLSGIIASASDKIKIINCKNNSPLSFETIYGAKHDLVVYMGGILGKGDGQIVNCSSTASLKITGCGKHYLGGLVGVFSGDITNSYASCKLSDLSENYNVCVGGLVGNLYGEVSNIVSCFSAGKIVFLSKTIFDDEVNGTDNVGFLFGEVECGINSSNLYYSSEISKRQEVNFYNTNSIVGKSSENNYQILSNSSTDLTEEKLYSGDDLVSLNRYISEEDVLINLQNVWVYSVGNHPTLYFEIVGGFESDYE